MIHLRTREEIAKIRRSARLVSETLGMLATEVKPGVTTLHLDRLAEEFVRDHGAKPSFKGLYGFPNGCCISVNAQVVHGIPNNEPLKEGDVVSIDFGAELEGYHGDQAFTFPVGEIDPKIARLLKVTRESIYKGIARMKAGNRIGDIGHAIQRHCEDYGYGVVRDLCGHGLGKKVHEDPQVPNYGRKGTGIRLKAGMAIAIEPMINAGVYGVDFMADGWGVRTKDRRPSSHYENTVVITENGVEILTL